jgi:multidrug efflux pump subunit AcrA (membrane-fusion protein)
MSRRNHEERFVFLPRLWVWMIIAAALLVGVFHVSPQQFPVVLYKLSMVTVSAVVAYWIDRSLFGESAQARMDPLMSRDTYSAARLLARALVYVGTVLGVTLGL